MPSGASPRREIDELADALHSAAIHLLRRVRRRDAESGLGPARLSALSVLVFGRPMRISELARTEGVTTPTMTAIVAALESGGLVTREADKHDGRASILRPTAPGRKLMAEGRARRIGELSAELWKLTEDDREILRRAAALMQQLSRKPPAGSRIRPRRGRA